MERSRSLSLLAGLAWPGLYQQAVVEGAFGQLRSSASRYSRPSCSRVSSHLLDRQQNTRELVGNLMLASFSIVRRYLVLDMQRAGS